MNVSTLHEELTRARNRASLGVLDLGLAAKSMIACGWLGAVQQELQAPDYIDYTPDSDHFTKTLAELPVSYSGIAVGVGTFAVTSVAGRIRSANKTEEVVEQSIQAMQTGNFIPYSEKQFKARRRIRSVGNFAVNAASAALGYKVGESLDIENALMAQASLLSVAGIRAVTYGKFRNFTNRFKSRRQGVSTEYDLEGRVIEQAQIPQTTGLSRELTTEVPVDDFTQTVRSHLRNNQ